VHGTKVRGTGGRKNAKRGIAGEHGCQHLELETNKTGETKKRNILKRKTAAIAKEAVAVERIRT